MSLLKLVLLALAASATARPSVNFGPHKIKSYVTSDSHIDDYHRAGLVELDPIEVARGLLRVKHPQAEFVLQSSTRSEHVGIAHYHFVQVLNGREVVDGLININVDEATGRILSYGDAVHVDRCAQLEAQFTRAAEQTIANIDKASGLVMQKQDSGHARVMAESKLGELMSEANVEALAECASPFIGRGGKKVVSQDEIVDPRAALVAFLLPIQSAKGVHVAEEDVQKLVDSIIIEHPLRAEGLSGENRINLLNVLDAEEAVPARLAYIQGEGDSVDLIWRFEYRSNDNWYEAGVAAETSGGLQTLYATDWMRDFKEDDKQPLPPIGKRPKAPQPDDPLPPDGPKKSPPVTDPHAATYRIYDWGCNDPTACTRSLVHDPADYIASPAGWHSIPRSSGAKALSGDWMSRPGWSNNLGGGLNSSTTVGNNVFAQDNPTGGNTYETNFRPVNESLVFDYKLHWGSKENRTGRDIPLTSYIDVSVTELFTTCNRMHDLFYRYGFDEQSGNFQQHNFGGKGRGGDPVIANAQDGSGMNNANFATPPDGQSGRMRMYGWDGALPYRDGDLEEGIVVHEISTRLVGGPANSGCLGWGEAGGMGEGIGDFFATMIRLQTAESYHHAHTMGQWAAGMKNGIRKYPYSTNMTISPEIYSTLDGFAYFGVHAIGEVWATMLNEVAVALMDKHGWTRDLFPPQAGDDLRESDFYVQKEGKRYPKHGNTLVLQLFVDAMKLAPCRPGFVQMRDAMIAADKHLTGGENYCTLWGGFAKRGLGPDAELGGGKHQDDFNLPKDCRKKA